MKRITILVADEFRDKVFDVGHEYRVSASDFIRVALSQAVEKYGQAATPESRHAFLDDMIASESGWLEDEGC